jgi:hypothetical protein
VCGAAKLAGDVIVPDLPLEVEMRIVVLAATAALAGGSAGAQQESLDAGTAAMVQEEVRRELRDPQSAEFRNFRLYRGQGMDAVCGEVNANNVDGGKAGFRGFLVNLIPEGRGYRSSGVVFEEVLGAGWAQFSAGYCRDRR